MENKFDFPKAMQTLLDLAHEYLGYPAYEVIVTPKEDSA